MRGKKLIISLICKLLFHKANMSILTITGNAWHTYKKKQKQKKDQRPTKKTSKYFKSEFLKVLPPESLAPSSSWFARVTAQDQVASGLHQLLSADSKKKNKTWFSIIRYNKYQLKIKQRFKITTWHLRYDRILRVKYLVKDVPFTDEIIDRFFIRLGLFFAWFKFWWRQKNRMVYTVKKIKSKRVSTY